MLNSALYFMFGATAFVLLSGCGGAADSPYDLTTRYAAAVRDAAVAEAEEIHTLRPVSGDAAVVLTWVDKAYAESYPVGGEVTLSWGDVWVTLVPDVHDKCVAFPEGKKRLRIQQLLGLPPKDEERVFVVLETDTGHLFRPCIAPDIATDKCPATGKAATAAHAEFFANQTALSYTQPGGYPWTRLGYTYDWNPSTPEFGVSEYVIRKGTTVRVTAVFETASYCR